MSTRNSSTILHFSFGNFNKLTLLFVYHLYFLTRLIYSETHLCHQFNSICFVQIIIMYFQTKMECKNDYNFSLESHQRWNEYWKGKHWYAWLRQQSGNNKVFEIGMMQLFTLIVVYVCSRCAIIIGLQSNNQEATHQPSSIINEANELHNCTILIDIKQINKSINNKWTKFFVIFFSIYVWFCPR